jgi:hypothetical protein
LRAARDPDRENRGLGLGSERARRLSMASKTLDTVYADFAQMYANSKVIRWDKELDAAIQAAGLDYAQVTWDWLASLNRAWVYNESDDPFPDPQINRGYRRLLNA